MKDKWDDACAYIKRWAMSDSFEQHIIILLCVVALCIWAAVVGIALAITVCS